MSEHKGCAVTYVWRYDSYFCLAHQVWTEPKCSDETCSYCSCRPDVPEFIPEPQIPSPSHFMDRGALDLGIDREPGVLATNDIVIFQEKYLPEVSVDDA